MQSYNALKKYVLKNGNARVKHDHITSDEIKLGAWVNRQKYKEKTKNLSKERKVLLEALNGWTWRI